MIIALVAWSWARLILKFTVSVYPESLAPTGQFGKAHSSPTVTLFLFLLAIPSLSQPSVTAQEIETSCRRYSLPVLGSRSNDNWIASLDGKPLVVSADRTPINTKTSPMVVVLDFGESQPSSQKPMIDEFFQGITDLNLTDEIALYSTYPRWWDNPFQRLIDFGKPVGMIGLIPQRANSRHSVTAPPEWPVFLRNRGAFGMPKVRPLTFAAAKYFADFTGGRMGVATREVGATLKKMIELSDKGR